MKKKILLSIVLIVALLGTMVYATESDLSPTIDSATLQSTPLVGTDENTTLTPSTDANTLQDTTLVDDSDVSGNYVIPEEWLRTISADDLNTTDDNSATVMSDDFQSEDVLEITNKGIDGNAFYAGKDVVMRDVDIYGDLFVAGENLTLQNVYVSGNVYAAAENLTIENGDITGNAYLAGGTIAISGTTIQDVFSASDKLDVTSNTYVRRNLNSVASSNMNITGATIGRHINTTTDNLVIGDNTKVTGSLNYISKNEASVSPNATVGKLNFKQAVEDDEEVSEDISSIAYGILTTMVKAFFVCGFIVLFAKGFIEKQKVDNIVTHIAVNTGLGLLWTLAVPIISIALMCTGVAVGLGFVVLAIYFIIFAISLSIVSVSIAAGITRKSECNTGKLFGISLLISLVIAVLCKIPTLGALVSMVVALAGMGLVFSGLKNKKVKKEVDVGPTTEV